MNDGTFYTITEAEHSNITLGNVPSNGMYTISNSGHPIVINVSNIQTITAVTN